MAKQCEIRKNVSINIHTGHNKLSFNTTIKIKKTYSIQTQAYIVSSTWSGRSTFVQISWKSSATKLKSNFHLRFVSTTHCFSLYAINKVTNFNSKFLFQGSRTWSHYTPHYKNSTYCSFRGIIISLHMKAIRVLSICTSNISYLIKTARKENSRLL